MKRGPFSRKIVYNVAPPPPPIPGVKMLDLLPGIALKESMGSRRHCSFQYPFQKPRDLILKSKLKIMKKKIIAA